MAKSIKKYTSEHIASGVIFGCAQHECELGGESPRPWLLVNGKGTHREVGSEGSRTQNPELTNRNRVCG